MHLNKTVAALSCALAFSTGAADVEPVYVVTVDSGTVELTNAVVQVTSGGGTTAVDFTNITSFAGGTFKKRGAGTLRGATALATFTGDILIEEGAYVSSKNGMLGPYVKNGGAGQLVVSNGASLVFAYTVKNEAKIYNSAIHIAGAGTAEYPGAIHNACTARQQDSMVYAPWYLDDDATIAMGNNSWRIDIASNFRLQDHTLTFKQVGSKNESLILNGSDVVPGAGHVIVDGVTLQPQSYGWSAKGWSGGVTNTLTFRNGAMFTYYGSSIKPDWTLIWESTSGIAPGGSASWGCGYGITDAAYWRAPVVINDTTLDIRSASTNRGYAFKNTLSGNGALRLRDGWLHLFGESTLEGSVQVWPLKYPSGLYLGHARAVNPDGAGVVLTNAVLELAGETTAYELPDVSIHVAAADTNVVFTGGGSGSKAKSFTKTGPGKVTLDQPLAVTGNLNLLGGTLALRPSATKLYSALPGLWKGVEPAVYTNAAGEEVSAGTAGATMVPVTIMDPSKYVILSNEVVSCMDWLKTPTRPPWTDHDSAIWGGYVWNRSPTNENWTFGISISGYSRFYFDGVNELNSDNNNKLNRVNKKNVTPGPHAILFKVNPRNYSTAGSNKPSSQPLWKAYGLALDRLGRNSTNAVDYVFPENAACMAKGGDGFFFTRDTRDTNDFTAAEYAACSRGAVTYSNVVAAAGTTLDLGEGNLYDLPVLNLTGSPTVLNGGLAVYGTWSLRAADLSSATPPTLAVAGALTFGPDAVLAVDDPAAVRRGVSHALATAAGGIADLPNAAALFAERPGRLVKSADGKSVTLEFFRTSTTVLVR